MIRVAGLLAFVVMNGVRYLYQYIHVFTMCRNIFVKMHCFPVVVRGKICRSRFILLYYPPRQESKEKTAIERLQSKLGKYQDQSIEMH